MFLDEKWTFPHSIDHIFIFIFLKSNIAANSIILGIPRHIHILLFIVQKCLSEEHSLMMHVFELKTNPSSVRRIPLVVSILASKAKAPTICSPLVSRSPCQRIHQSQLCWIPPWLQPHHSTCQPCETGHCDCWLLMLRLTECQNQSVNQKATFNTWTGESNHAIHRVWISESSASILLSSDQKAFHGFFSEKFGKL